MKIAIVMSQLCVMLRNCINTGKIDKISVGELFLVILFLSNQATMKKVELQYINMYMCIHHCELMFTYLTKLVG